MAVAGATVLDPEGAAVADVVRIWLAATDATLFGDDGVETLEVPLVPQAASAEATTPIVTDTVDFAMPGSYRFCSGRVRKIGLPNVVSVSSVASVLMATVA